MIYEVYKLLDNTGRNIFIASERSMKKASVHCHEGVFMVVERIRKFTDPCGLTVFKDGMGVGAIMMLPQYGNIIKNQQDGERFWSTRQSYFRN